MALLCVAAMWPLSRITPALGLTKDIRWLLTGVFVLVGISFDLRGLLVFFRARTSINPMKPNQASSLVVMGAYSLNPCPAKSNPLPLAFLPFFQHSARLHSRPAHSYRAVSPVFWTYFANFMAFPR